MRFRQIHLFPFLLASLCLVLWSACSSQGDRVSIEGDFDHLDQGSFLIYSSDGLLENLDSIHIRDGHFTYELPITEAGTLHLLYPNYSQLTLFARPGDELYVKGDARKLSEVSVKGSKDNEQYTAFRHAIIGMNEQEARQVAAANIEMYPTSAMARHLFLQYFLQKGTAERSITVALYDSLLRANPADVQLSRMSSLVSGYRRLEVGETLPEFRLTLRANAFTEEKTDSTVSDTTFHGKYLLMFFWATWKSDARNSLYYARQHRQKSGMKNQAILSYSLDTDDYLLLQAEKKDSINYASFCDFKAFGSPLAQKWGITDVPFFIYADPDGKILASGKDWKKDIEPTVKKLSWTKE